MRKYISLVMGMLMTISAVYSQSVVTFPENFDGNTISFTPFPASAWKIDSNYYVSPPNSIRGVVPNMTGDSVALTSQVYDFTNYQHVLLRFNHICKISPQDIARVEYRIDMGGGVMGAWKVLPATAYLGKATINQAGMYEFNANTYPEWKGNDSLALPDSSWWKEEIFDLQYGVGKAQAQFRFVLKHGTASGTQISYGWLIDNIEIIAAPYGLTPPIVELIETLVKDTVHSAGPYTIYAKVKSRTDALIETPWLKYIATNNGTLLADDSILMTMVAGDSLWKEAIPQFILGSEVIYSITGKDTNGNSSYVSSGYIIVKLPHNYGNNSVALTSIDMNDSIVIAPGLQIPIVATIKNKGDANLTSATIYYSVNGNTPQEYNWTGNLSWEFNAQVTVGNYTPKFNGYDTLIIWVEQPNGLTDVITQDDTLQKTIYGSPDILIAFINSPKDTVYYTGSFAINARIRTLSGAVAGTTVSLNVATTYSGITTSTTLPMTFDIGANLWRTTIPNKLFESNIVYSITLTDNLTNVVTAVDSFYIKRIGKDSIADYFIYAESDTGGYYGNRGAIYQTAVATSWSRTLYLANEISADIKTLIISKLAWYNRSEDAGQVRTDLKVYTKATTNRTNPLAYVDPLTDGASLVYSGNITSQLAWNEVVLTTPFIVPLGSNLQIYFEENTGSIPPPIAGVTWAVSSGSIQEQNRTVYIYNNVIQATSNLPVMRFSFREGTLEDSNSVALASIDSPENTGIIVGQSIPVRVTIHNRGIQNLDSCLINWTLNGQPQAVTTYYGDLSEDFTDTVTIGNYTPSFRQPDNIVIWVSMPNGVLDTITSDDTLSVTTIACFSNGLSGNYVIGNSISADFSSLETALSILKTCGIDGKVTFALENGVYQSSINLSYLMNILTVRDTLVLTSVSGNASDVTLQSDNVGITLESNRNIIIQALTIDVSNKGTYAIQFTGACTNIVIRDCRLFANPIGNTTSFATIYKASGTGIANNIFILNNLLDGGSYGFHFYGGTGNTAYGTHVVFDSNIISNQYDNGIRSYYTDFISCSYNTVTSRTTNTKAAWVGFYLSYCNGAITSNKIVQHSNTITQPYGIWAQYYNFYSTQDTGLIANNEIILNAAGAYSGIYLNTYTRAKILHNSIYMSGTGIAMGIQVVDNSNSRFVIRNNNIMMESAMAYPLYLNILTDLSLYDIDYNNMYAPQHVGYAGKNITSISAWQQTITTDHNSVCILPIIVDPTISLELSHSNLLCNILSPVNQDIKGVTRTGSTTMGCYHAAPFNGDAWLKEIMGLREGNVLGQTDSMKIIVSNTGSFPVTSINVGWSVNGIIKNNNLNIPVSLTLGGTDTLTFGTVNYTSGTNVVKVWINNLNGGTLVDDFSRNDTIVSSTFVCNGSYNGTLTIGTTGDFPNIEDAYYALKTCGVNGNIILAFQSGTHIGNLDLTNSADLFGNYSLTVTSLISDANDATFSSLQGPVILCNNTNNVIIKDITIDATLTNYGIQLSGTSNNITIINSAILASPSATATACIYKPTNTGSLNGLTVKNCVIDGGYYGIYLYGTSANYCQNITIDNNTVGNQDNGYGIYLYYVNSKSISYNRISPRTTSGSTWNALYCYYLRNGGNIIGNRISANTAAITITGISLYYTDSALVANNEIYINGNGFTIDGLYVSNPRNVEILHNTVYTSVASTTATNRAHYNHVASGCSSTIKHNLFIAQGGSLVNTYAFYFTGTAANYNTYNVNYKVDYNNYYSSGNNIGYVAGLGRANLTAWKIAAAPLDSHSVNILPVFNNPAVDLSLAMYPDTLLCPRLSDVNTDILALPRPLNTAMGAYSQTIDGQDLMLINLLEWNTEVIRNQTAPIDVNLFNTGAVPITNATLGWSLNGVDKGSVLYTFNPALNPAESQTVSIDQISVTSSVPNYDVVVWIEDINGEADTVNWNDTIKASASIKPLAEFVAPIIQDTTLSISLPVNVFIRSWTGATTVSPKLTLVSTVHGTTTVYDTVSLQQNGNIWQETIPKQYYGTKVVYSLSLTDTIGNSIILTDSTYIRNALSILEDASLISLSLSEPINTTGCQPDYTPVKITLTNKGTIAYDFSKDTILFELDVIDADSIKHTESIPFTGILQPGENTIELMSALPTIHPGTYNIKIWINSRTDNTIWTDTLKYTYISGKFGLPLDEDFSNGIPLELNLLGENTSATWQVISQGTGADAAVQPVFGDSILSFTGTPGAITTLSTRQLDLSRTVQPALSFWYFHDTIPCEDYTDVRMTVDGGETYNTLFSLTKYNTVYGWQQYSMDLPSYAVNQCVILVFEAMEKSRSGNVAQYIDRILITAKQDIAISEIITSELTACDLQNKEVKVVLSNLTDPVLDFTTAPVTLTLEILGTGQAYTHTLDSGSLGRFASDTISMATGIDFSKGNYTLKAYFSSILDVDRENDTLVIPIVINPALSVSVHPESSPANCLTGELVVNPTITLYNTGNMDLSDIDIILQVDTGDNNIAVYALFKETYTGIILAGDTATYMFDNFYSVPWNARYDVRTYAYLSCDSVLVNSTNMVTECVDTKDLYIVSIDNPSGTSDAIGATVNVTATLHNRADNDFFSNSTISVLVEDSKRVEFESFTENLPTIETSATVSHTFTLSYTVPHDSVYYLTVFVNNQDSYPNNDTMTIKRYTENVGIEALKGSNIFTLGQNIPNPANNRTRIDYSIPEAGEVIFNLHSVSGQLLYSKTIETASGKQSLELNTSTFAAGIYFYSIEYKGQRIVKRLMISD